MKSIQANKILVSAAAIGLVLNLAQPSSAQVGTVWKKTSTPAVWWTSIASSADGNRLLAGTVTGPAYISTDAGATWTATSVSVGSQAGNTVASSANGAVLAVTSLFNNNIFVSTDSGANWTARAIAANWTGIACSSNGTKMVAVADNGQIYTSTDTGVTWTPRETSRHWNAVASSADGSKLVAAVGSFNGFNPGRIYTSTDSGVNWTPRAFDQVWTGLASSADGSKLAATVQFDSVNIPGGYNGQIYLSSDSGTNWTAPGNWTSPAMNYVSVASSADGTRLAAAATPSGGPNGQGYSPPPAIGLFTSTGWSLAYAPAESWTSIASSADGTKLAATVNGAIYTYAEPSTNLPTLNIAMANGSAYLSWLWPSTGFVLQQNSDLLTTNWVTIPGTPAVVNQVISATTNNSNFYRLFKP